MEHRLEAAVDQPGAATVRKEDAVPVSGGVPAGAALQEVTDKEESEGMGSKADCEVSLPEAWLRSCARRAGARSGQFVRLRLRLGCAEAGHHSKHARRRQAGAASNW